ncbi:hypothetical protein [Aquimarina agarivorans]|uniref:hypothetical protein n=1 Tax=Aquimarina agarivorans TaxID=980584 RepID=UPI000248F89E|nr:hypothetical protein [Aquimarina agarivorans]
MKSNGVYESETVIDENALEESFNGKQEVENASSEFDEAVNEFEDDVNESDYQEVTSTDESNTTANSENPFEGGADDVAQSEAYEKNSNEATLEQVNGYDYSIVEEDQEHFAESDFSENAINAY